MKVRAQIGMVLNLDKCIGCHTCSVTCKNVWTSRPGMEYAWFNNVETKPGIGYPKEWENQGKWKGGWIRKADGSIEPRQGGKWQLLMKIFSNPNLPQIDDYYEPFTFDYDHLQSAPEMKAAPTARPRSLITGQRMEKIEWGPNWEEILGGEFAKRSKDANLANFDKVQKEMVRPVREHLHDVPAAPVRALPESGVRRVLPVGLDLQARGRRHRPDRPGQVPRLAHVRLGLSVQEDLLQLAVRQGREVHLLLSAHRSRPADGVLGNLRRAASATSAWCCTTPTASRKPPASENEKDLYQAQLDIFLDPNDPKVIAQARCDGIPDAWMEARAQAARSTRWRWTGRWRCRCIRNTARCRWSGTCRRCRRSAPRRTPATSASTARFPTCSQLRIPVQYLANLLTAGDTGAGGAGRSSACWRCAPTSAASMSTGSRTSPCCEQVGLTAAQVEEMYQVMAIANYEDRFVIPSTHREYAENTFDMKGGCGFSFGNGCSEGSTETSLFGGKKRRTIPIKSDGLKPSQ